MKIRLLTLLILASASTMAGGSIDQEAYIEKYKDIAIREMKKYGIPASITLAQGILESGNGKSYLAVEGNNHFGIKCHLDWDGRRIYHDDDEKNECFRSYKNAEESFRDHSLFLKNRSRYAFLFEESPTDYKAWARGLKKAGYATNRKYPQLLIDIIEANDLHKYDLKGYNVDEELAEENAVESFQINVSKNYVKFILVKEGDTYESLSEATKVRVNKLMKYNDLNWNDKLQPGERLYLQPKRRKAAIEFKTYTVQQGDNMHAISQKFAVKLERLYKRNDMVPGQKVEVGTVLELR